MKRNVAMLLNYLPKNLSLMEPDFWKTLGFPLVEDEDDLKEELANFKNYTKFYVNCYQHGDVHFDVSLEKREEDWDYNPNVITFFVNTKDEKMINRFRQEIENLFKEMEKAINGFGWELDEETFWEEVEDFPLNDKIKDDYMQSLIESNTAKGKTNVTLAEMQKQTDSTVDEMIKNRNPKLYEKYEKIINEYYQEKQTEAYEFPDYEFTGVYYLEKTLEKMKLENKNKTNKR